MTSDDRHKIEGFSLEIENAVEDFFSHYEENAPKMDVSFQESGSDIVSGEENASEPDGSSLDDVFAMLSESEKTHQTGGTTTAHGPDKTAGGQKTPSEETESGPTRLVRKRFDPSATHVFNSLTEAILTVDWEVNEANVREARDILEKIQANFPVLKESRTQEVIDGMMTTLDDIATCPQRVPTSAIAHLEKAIPILRGIASGAQMGDAYNELIKETIAGLEACRAEDEPAKDERPNSPGLAPDDPVSFDNGDGAAPNTRELAPIAVQVEVSRALSRHSKVVAELVPRAKRLSDLYAAARGSENVQVLLQKICRLLELQTRALEEGFSLNFDIAVFPVGKIKNVSDFLDFQRMAMGACLRHGRVLEKTFKKTPHRRRFQQSMYFLRIAMEEQLYELSRAAVGDDPPAGEEEPTVPAPL